MSCSSCGGSRSTRATGARDKTCACQTSTAPQWPCTQALDGGLERTRYYEGMVLSRADLDAEQTYWRTKRQLTNRALGDGIVWGLRTEWDPRGQSFSVAPGYALDCCGNDVVVDACQVIGARSLIERSNPVVQGILASDTRRAHLILRYVEAPEAPTAVSTIGCTGASERWEPSRIRESAQLCLVEPPAPTSTGPVGAFLQELESWRAGLDSETQALLFPPSQDPDLGAPLELHLRVGDIERILVPEQVEDTQQWVFPSSALVQLKTATEDPQVQVVLELRARPGWVIHTGQVVGREAVLAEAQAPWDLRLAWALDLSIPTDDASASTTMAVRAKGLQLARLFSPDDRVDVALSLPLEFTVERKQADGPGVWDVSMTPGHGEGRMEVQPAKTPGPDPDCFAALDPSVLFLHDDVATTGVRPLLLAGLYGWFARSMRGLDGVDGHWSGHRVLAQWSMAIAWRLLFGADVGSGQDQERFSALLHALLQRWCQGFHYAGPRCTTDHQGVVLGTVTLGRNGRVQGFDAWDGRRQVLTGPLLTHWMGQLGLAAPDVMVSRVVRSLCCIGDGPVQSLPPWASLLQQRVGLQQLDALDLGHGAVGLTGGAAVLVGTDDELEARLAAHRIRVSSRETVSATRFLKLAAQTLADADTVEGLPSRVIRIEGQTGRRWHLLVPADPAAMEQARAEDAALRALIHPLTGDAVQALGPLAEAPLVDLATVVARVVEVPDTGMGLYERLAAADQASLGRALGVGAEAAFAQAREVMPPLPPGAFNDHWRACLKQLEEVVERLIKAISLWESADPNRVFTRAALLDGDLHAGVDTLLDGQNMGRPWVGRRAASAACADAHAMG